MTHEELQRENEGLRQRLAEAEDALNAIRGGQVDAIVVDGAAGTQVFSLTGAETVYRLAIETMAEAALNVSPDGTILFCNARFGDFVATPQERLVGHDVSEYVAEEDRNRFRALLQLGLHHPVNGRFVLCGPGSACTPVRLSAYALNQPGNNSICLLALDLTELESSAQQIVELRRAQAELREARRSALNIMEDAQAAERALRESEERMQQALRVSRSFTFDWQPTTDQVQRSTSCADILRLSGDEAIRDTGKNFFARIHPDDRTRFRQVLQSLSPAAPSYTTEYRVNRGDGSIVVLEETGKASFDESGRLTGVTGVTTDITERKKSEEALKTAHAELERRALELAAVNRELEAFSYTVSHDLKTPLRSIDGFARALLEDYKDRLDDTSRDYLARVNSATLRMNQLIDAMLNLARLTGGQLHEKTVDLSALVQVAVHELRKHDPERQTEIVVAKKISARGDQDMLTIALQNLLDNAWKFTAGRQDAKIEFGALDMDGRTVYFVRDNGAGFDMRFADKLFQPFKRLHSGSEFPGLGIGLAIAHRIILRHGGRMWAEAAVGKGATFFFTLG